MRGRFGNRAPGCSCDYHSTCRACLLEAGHRATAARFGVHQDVSHRATDDGEVVPVT